MSRLSELETRWVNEAHALILRLMNPFEKFECNPRQSDVHLRIMINTERKNSLRIMPRGKVAQKLYSIDQWNEYRGQFDE